MGIRKRHIVAMGHVSRFVPLREDSNVLDLGCRDGAYLRMIKGEKYGLDLDAEAVERAKANGVQAQVLDICVQPFPFPDGFFDLVLCLDILEHLQLPASVLPEVKRVLKPDGYVYATVPNEVVSLTGLLRMLVGKHFLKDPLTAPHIRFFVRRTLQNLFSDNGFDILRSDGGLQLFASHFFVVARLKR